MIRNVIKKIRVAVVGSGPAGFYTTQMLVKNPYIHVDIYEKLPVPYGLIRYGVAPDHQDVKNVIKSFSSMIEKNQDRVNFYGNIGLGKDVSLDDLVESYHAVILCYGAGRDKKLNIEGEDAKNSISARNFVGWYNGLPEDKDLDIDLNCDTACIIGHGNVSLDCARMLLRSSDLAKTDITSHAYQMLAKSRIRKIYLIGRRGPAQVSFSVKELRELIKMNESATTLEPSTIFSDAGVSLSDINRLPRQRQRLIQLLLNVSANSEVGSPLADSFNDRSKIQTIFKFLAKPIEIFTDTSGRVRQLHLQKTEYSDVTSFMDSRVRPTEIDAYEAIDCGLIIKSVGFKPFVIDRNLPMDTKNNCILNTNGRVPGLPNVYVSGWLATGPSGVIAGTLNSSRVTAQRFLSDLESNELPNLNRNKLAFESVERKLPRDHQIIHFNQWNRIDQMEERLGAVLGKIREKLDINKMLEVAQGEKIKPT